MHLMVLRELSHGPESVNSALKLLQLPNFAFILIDDDSSS